MPAKKKVNFEVNVLNATQFKKGNAYIINLSDKWLDRMTQTNGKRKLSQMEIKTRMALAKKTGQQIVDYLDGHDISAMVLAGDIIAACNVPEEDRQIVFGED